jgi:sugar phosphate isomerase/epimerase
MADLARLAINQATTRPQWSLAEAIRGYAAQGVRGIGVWRDKLEELGPKTAAAMLSDHGMAVTGLCRSGLFAAADASGRQAAIDDARQALDEAAAIGAPCLVIIGGGLAPGSRSLADARAGVRDGLAALLEHARGNGVALAIEPMHPMYAADRGCINTLRHANDLCDELGEGVGVAVDVYHVWWDPTLEAEIRRAGSRILGFHTCDWRVPTRDLLVDRAMMGDGVIDIALIRGWVDAAGYDGFCEVEIFSEADWWRRPAEEVVAACIARHQSHV